MKTLMLCVCLLAMPGGEREKGLQAYKEGRYADAAAAFRAAIATDGESAELHYNLALACWRAGDLAAAETAVEKYAALDANARADLHAGLLGAVRHDEAEALAAKADALQIGAPAPDAPPADPLPLLQQALEKAEQSRTHFLRGIETNATPELVRNTERALRTIEELRKKIEELERQRQEQQQDQQKNEDQKKDEQEKPDEKKPDEKPEQPPPDAQQSDQKKPGEPKPDASKPEGKGEEKPEPKPEAPPPKAPKSEPHKQAPGKPDESKSSTEPAPAQPEPKPVEAGEQQPRSDAPGEAVEGKELSPEQAQRLLEQLKELDQKLKLYRARAKSGRGRVERDW
jgi:tetratricopeptide (TPR) repeat protein